MHTLRTFFTLVSSPIRKNATFFVFMYVLGIVCVCTVEPAYEGLCAYNLAPLELFADVYVLCLLLALLPRVLRLWVRRIVYVIAYATAIIDVFCFVKFNTTITPAILQAVSKTDMQEATAFLMSYVSADVFIGRLGRVLLVLLAHIVFAVILFRIRRSHMLGGVRFQPRPLLPPLFGVLICALLVWSFYKTIPNKVAMYRIMTLTTFDDVETEMTQHGGAEIYLPAYRWAFSIYANTLDSKQAAARTDGSDGQAADSCLQVTPDTEKAAEPSNDDAYKRPAS